MDIKHDLSDALLDRLNNHSSLGNRSRFYCETLGGEYFGKLLLVTIEKDTLGLFSSRLAFQDFLHANEIFLLNDENKLNDENRWRIKCPNNDVRVLQLEDVIFSGMLQEFLLTQAPVEAPVEKLNFLIKLKHRFFKLSP